MPCTPRAQKFIKILMVFLKIFCFKEMPAQNLLCGKFSQQKQIKTIKVYWKFLCTWGVNISVDDKIHNIEFNWRLFCQKKKINAVSFLR